MKMLRTLFLASLLLAQLCACGNPQAASNPTPDAPSAEPPKQETSAAEKKELPFETISDDAEPDEETTTIEDSTDGQPLLTACIVRPNVDGLVEDAVKKTIDRYYDELYREEKAWWTGGLVDFARENKKNAADYGGNFFPFSVRESSEIVYDGEAFLSIQRDTEVYTGGAHGSHVVSCENFRKTDGSLVSLKDLFRIDSYKEVLLHHMAGWVANQNISADYYEGWEEMLDTNFNENSFSIGGEALTVFYQEYDIAPYAAGAQALPIPYADISNELSESFLRDIYGGKK